MGALEGLGGELDGSGGAPAGEPWPPVGAVEVPLGDLYERLAAGGFDYGPTFQCLRAVWRRDGDLFAEVSLPEEQWEQADLFALHPALLDGALHALAASSLGEPGDELAGLRLPFSWSEVRLGARGASVLRVCLSPAGDGGVSVCAVDGTGARVCSVGSLVMRPVSVEQLGGVRDAGGQLLCVGWVPVSGGAPEVVERLVLGGVQEGGVQDEGAVAAHVCAGETLKRVQEWLAEQRLADTRLAVVSSGAVAVGAHEDVADLGVASVWGLVRAAQLEHPGRLVLIDVDGAPASWEAVEVAAGCGEPQVAVRGGELFAPRLAPVGSGGALSAPVGVSWWRLEAGRGGTLEELALVGCPEVGGALEAGQVRVGVRAAGVNFRDVLIALGVYPGEASVGGEGAGVVLEVGPGVEDLASGDRVVGLLRGAFGPVAVGERRLLARVPEGWSFAQAASVPVAFLTAYYALVDLAGLRAGERLVVHAATGGVGRAAVQLARHLGAEVFATASPGKWGVLEGMGVGEERIASSRTPEFRERFLEATGGRGVDVVLDCLAGELVDASLDLLSQGGRFVEMGKTDVRDPAVVAAEHAGVVYRAFELMDAGPERIQEMLGELWGLFERGVLSVPPVKCWDVRRAPEAFRFMSQARHVGKNVLMVPAVAGEWGGTALVTGGTGGLGALLARHLVLEHGVRSLLLASRRGLQAPGAQELAHELEGLGAEVRVRACDVSDCEQLRALLGEVPREYPLSVVVHAAGVLDDGVLEALSEERLGRVLAPKVDGAWHLHELTRELDLRAFVLYSSAVATLGGAGQANYAAANAFLDALAVHRRALGLPGVALAWGYWAQQTEMTGGLTESDRARIASGGMRALSDEQGLELFDAACGLEEAIVLPVKLDHATLRAHANTGELPPLLAELGAAGLTRRARSERSARRARSTHEQALAQRLAGVPDAERKQVVCELVRSLAAAVLGHASPEAVDPESAFKALGFDSLTAVELRNRLSRATGLKLPTTLIFDYPNALAVAGYLLGELDGVRARPVAPVRTGALGEPVAVVGMSCRYPGGDLRVSSPEDLWRLVAGGEDAISAFPSDRGWDVGRMLSSDSDSDSDSPGRSYTCEGGFVREAAEFDAGFFGIAPREALAMDPQQRLMLEACWEALEDAGLDPAGLRGSQTGVFAGAIANAYAGVGDTAPPTGVESYLMVGATSSVVSGRVAYTLGLEGPAMTVDTACSSSLVALHLACQSLRGGECSLALAGGVTVLATPGVFVDFARQRGLARDGRCKSFADAADGAGFSEGVGIVLLERLSDAERNNHRVLALLRGSAVNQDGASNGLTAPNGPSQERVIRQALANAGLTPREVGAVEGHGTGTRLGDPIEARALLAVYGQDRDEGHPLWLGSIKSNIGHAQAAAGVAGVIKMVLALSHERLPRTLHVDEPTREVDWDAGAVSLLTEEVGWTRNGEPRRAGVSSFGISGTNAHLIVEEAPTHEHSTPARDAPPAAGALAERAAGALAERLLEGGALPWVVSGKGVQALRAQAQRLAEHVEGEHELEPADVAYSLVAARSRFGHRAVVVGGRGELLTGLGALARGEAAANVFEGQSSGGRAGLAYLFTGQGAQRAGAGAALCETFPGFASALGEVCEQVDTHLERPLREALFARAGTPEAELLDRTEFTQPGLFALEVALFRLLEGFGLTPDFLVGHSVGELAAAHVAGVLSLPDACALVAARGRLMGSLPQGGAMVAVQASEEEALQALVGHEHAVAIAALNGPRSVVLSGDERAVVELTGLFERQGRKTRRLRVSHAFHSPRMDGMLEEFAKVAAGVSFSEPRIPIVSNVSGRLLEAEQACSAGYWVRHVRATVRFADGVRLLADRGVGSFLELGPDGVLSALGQECLAASHETGGELEASCGANGVASHSHGAEGELEASREANGKAFHEAPAGERAEALFVPALRAQRPEAQSLVGALAQLHARGVGVEFGSLFADRAPRPVGLPTYAFQRERYWLQAGVGASGLAAAGQASAEHPLLGATLALAEGDGRLFTGRLSLQSHPWLADHAVQGTVLLAGTAFVELALHAGWQVGCELVRELVLEAPLVLGEGEEVQLQLVVGAPDETGCRALDVYSRVADGSVDGALAGEGWRRNAGGVLAPWALGDVEGLPHTGSDGALEGLGGELDGSGGAPAGEPWPPVGAVEVPLGDLYERLAAGGFDYGPTFQCLRAVWRRDGDLFAEVSLPEEQWEQADLFALHPALLDGALHALAASSLGEPGDELAGLRLPFSWSEVRLGARGASVLRVCLSPAGDGGVSVCAVDGTGARVCSVGSLVMRPVSVEQLGGVRDAGGQLLCVGWVPVSGGAPEVVERLVLGGVQEGGVQDEGAVAAHVCAGETLKRVQEWLAEQRLADTRLAVVSSGAVAVGAHEDVADLGVASVWGLVRAAQLEHPGRLVLIDVDGAPASWEAVEVAAGCGEPQVAVRGGELFAPRLAPVGSGGALSAPVGVSWWRLEAGRGGTLEELALVGCPEVGGALEAGQVRVGVRAAGVNFRDVLIALGVYPGEASVGGEGAGVVLEVGPGVEDLASGDRVVGLLRGAFGPVAVGERRLLARVPEGWSFAQAASVPVAFLTAYYALVDLAGLKAGERLVVHAATGGVGGAAVQLARHLGAEVFATASPGKWGVLEGMGVGEERIASSRTPEFRERFLEATGGRGVDVVLDCLAGELVDASLDLLSQGGRFVEMGKTDVRDPAVVAAEHAGVVYRAFELMDAGPERIQEMLGELWGLFERGVLSVPPVKCWDVRRAPEAFRFMSQARHVGKNVLMVPAVAGEWGGTALVTGGTGGLGALLARHLVLEHGVRSLLLASRRGLQAPGAQELAHELEGLGAEVRVRACDVSDCEQLRALLGEVPREYPLSVVVHAAGVLDDGVLEALSEERLGRVLAPKVDGAWHLHELTRELDLRAFVLYSSAVATLGGAGQANYAAANAFLDALAVHRRALGLPGVALAWGYWAQQTEMTGGLTESDRARIASGGMRALSDEQGLELFDAACGLEEAIVLPVKLDHATLRAQANTGELPPLLAELGAAGLTRRARSERSTGRGTGTADQQRGGLARRLAGASAQERARVVLDVVRVHTATVLGHASPAAVEVRQTFKELGFDSLTAVELRNRLSRASGVRLPTTLVFDYPTPAELAEHLQGVVASTNGSAARSSVEAELAELERRLASIAADDAGRATLTARLQRFLAGLNGGSDAAQDDEDVRSATAQDVYELIDRELGDRELGSLSYTGREERGGET